jgi:hypothetical protein
MSASTFTTVTASVRRADTRITRVAHGEDWPLLLRRRALVHVMRQSKGATTTRRNQSSGSKKDQIEPPSQMTWRYGSPLTGAAAAAPDAMISFVISAYANMSVTLTSLTGIRPATLLPVKARSLEIGDLQRIVTGSRVLSSLEKRHGQPPPAAPSRADGTPRPARQPPPRMEPKPSCGRA